MVRVLRATDEERRGEKYFARATNVAGQKWLGATNGRRPGEKYFAPTNGRLEMRRGLRTY